MLRSTSCIRAVVSSRDTNTSCMSSMRSRHCLQGCRYLGFAGALTLTVHPKKSRSCASMRPRHCLHGCRYLGIAGAIFLTVHPVKRRSCASMRPRHCLQGCRYLGFAGAIFLTVHPVKRRSCASMRPRHTVHPVHNKTGAIFRSLPFQRVRLAFSRSLSDLAKRLRPL